MSIAHKLTLNQITLPAVDIERSKSFYRRMGFLQIVDSPHYARFEASGGDATFSLHLTEEPPVNGASVYFEVDDVSAVCRELAAEGFEFLHEPTEQRYLWTEARLADPSGNVIVIYNAGRNRKHPPWRREIRE